MWTKVDGRQDWKYETRQFVLLFSPCDSRHSTPRPYARVGRYLDGVAYDEGGRYYIDYAIGPLSDMRSAQVTLLGDYVEVEIDGKRTRVRLPDASEPVR